MNDTDLRIVSGPGRKIAVLLPPEAGFPIELQIGQDRAFAWVDKERRRSGRPGVDLVAWRWCPDTLADGVYDLTVHDQQGTRPVGKVKIERPPYA